VLWFFGVKITGILMSWFGSNYSTFVVGRLLVGGGQVGFYISGFVLGILTVTVHVTVNHTSNFSTIIF